MARDDRLPKQLPLLPADYMLSDDLADPRLGMSDEEIDAHWESVMWIFEPVRLCGVRQLSTRVRVVWVTAGGELVTESGSSMSCVRAPSRMEPGGRLWV